MEQDVIDFLKSNPTFFERHADLLTELYLPNPHGEGAISLAQRQQMAQRDKIRVLESKFTELVINAEENEKTAQKVHHLTLELLAAQNFETLDSQLNQRLSEEFDLPNSQLKVWSSSEWLVDHVETFTKENEAIMHWAQNLSQPYCGKMPPVDMSEWFDSAPASIAIVPLKDQADHTFGLMLFPSQDEHHFYSGMGTLFLNRIGELVSALLLRYIK